MKKLLIAISAIAITFAATQLIAGGNAVPTGSIEKFPVCHKFGTPAEKTLWVPEVAVAAHVGHGDSEGDCQVDPG